MKKSLVLDRRGVWSFVLVPLALLLAGCGSDGPGVHVQGMVTHNGQPVPRGHLTFSPDTTKGNSGPGSFAVIENGRYTTQDALGTVGGPHIVRIEGFTGVPDGENSDGKRLFEPYIAEVDLTAASGDLDFNIED